MHARPGYGLYKSAAPSATSPAAFFTAALMTALTSSLLSTLTSVTALTWVSGAGVWPAAGAMISASTLTPDLPSNPAFGCSFFARSLLSSSTSRAAIDSRNPPNVTWCQSLSMCLRPCVSVPQPLLSVALSLCRVNAPTHKQRQRQHRLIHQHRILGALRQHRHQLVQHARISQHAPCGGVRGAGRAAECARAVDPDAGALERDGGLVRASDERV